MERRLEKSMYLGVNIDGTRRPFTLGLLDETMKIEVVKHAQLEELLAYAAGDDVLSIGINAPSNVNHGLMQEEAIRARFTPPVPEGRYENMRLAEYEVVRRGARIQRTPEQVGKCPLWMRTGFVVYERIEELGYSAYAGEDVQHHWLEVPADAGFHSLVSGTLLGGKTLQGRIQRQLILWAQEVQVPDPMETFEEITRHRLMHGNFPFRSIFPIESLNALLAAYTAWLSHQKPQKLISLGSSEEGAIYLPTNSRHYF
jgi:hypothetical protein